MTLVVSWLRSVGNTRELLMASDSRLRFGCAWDCAPKILKLPRGDSAIGFAGDTMHTYPYMLQLISAIENHHKANTRAMDIRDLKGYALRIFAGMRDYIHDFPQGESRAEPPDAQFLLAGYSWQVDDFKIWRFHFDQHINRYTFTPTHRWRGENYRKLIRFEGDRVKDAKSRLSELLRNRNKHLRGGFDMEPFEVLRDMIRDDSYPEIGGPPQLIKIYKHMNCVPYAVFWPHRETGV